MFPNILCLLDSWWGGSPSLASFKHPYALYTLLNIWNWIPCSCWRAETACWPIRAVFVFHRWRAPLRLSLSHLSSSMSLLAYQRTDNFGRGLSFRMNKGYFDLQTSDGATVEGALLLSLIPTHAPPSWFVAGGQLWLTMTPPKKPFGKVRGGWFWQVPAEMSTTPSHKSLQRMLSLQWRALQFLWYTPTISNFA